MSHLVTKIVQKTGIEETYVRSIISLIREGNTIPFIARYRKEMTGGATDEQLRDFEELYAYQQKLIERKDDILRLMTEKDVLTDELRAAIQDAQTLSALEDIYRPYKDKKNTRATKAIAKGLQPLADILLACEISSAEFATLAESYIVDSGDPKTSVTSQQEAIQWAMDIVAEIVADHPELRAQIKDTQQDTVPLTTTPTKHYQEHSVYENYKEYTKPLSQMPNYAYLAISRAEKEKQLRVKLSFSEASSLTQATKILVPHGASDLQETLLLSLQEGIKRLLHPSLERELRSAKKETSDREAIDIFGQNVEELLLGAPVRGKTMMWFDPAYRTGCKLAVIDHTGKYLASDVIYPMKSLETAQNKLLSLIQTHDIQLICIGNGTASRESEQLVADLIQAHSLDTKYLVVSEAGASVYSASKLATAEYPDLDVTIRGAINIAQRIQDPLSTYVKIDPKSLWVGQYQHDVDQKLLKEKLDNHIENAVNRVGVDLNTASASLLQYIAWLSSKIATNIVTHREEIGTFAKRTQIKKVAWLWPKAFEQCAWFLRIAAAQEQLDSTGIHPESYKTVYTILKSEYNISKKSLTLPYIWPADADLDHLAQTYDIGLHTLEDIVRELADPWLDPREDFDESGFKSDVLSIEDLKKWMKLKGIVRNITDFWAFVDIGLKNDWLVHKSQIADSYVSNVFDVVSIWEQLDVWVLDVDMERSRVSLSAKTDPNKSSWSTKKSTALTTKKAKTINKKSAGKDKKSESVWFQTKSQIVWK